MSIDDKGGEIEHSIFENNRFLSFVRVEAEDILYAWNRIRYLRPSWDPYIPTKYDPPDEACLRINNIWTYVILFFLSILILGGLCSIVLWLPISRYTLLTVEYYIGIVNAIYVFVIMLIYLIMRLKSNIAK